MKKQFHLLWLTLACMISLQAVGQDFNKNYIGMNLGNLKDWEQHFVFADAIKQAREWKLPDGSRMLNATEVDVNGWPKVDAQVLMAANEDLHGTYSLSFDGQATIAFSGGTVSNINYNGTKTTATIVITNSESINATLTLTNTSGGVRNVKMMRPITPGSSTPHNESELFCRDFVTVVSKFNFIRYMDWLGTNSDAYHQNTEWNTRTTPGYFTQACAWPVVGTYAYTMENPATGLKWYNYQGKGGSWEYVIALANLTNTDVWISIPHAATDDYITKVAKTFKYGSDGTNPYNSTQTNPVYAPLKSELKLYVEYSNEVWNWGFPCANYNKNIAENEERAFFDYLGDGKNLWCYRIAHQTAVISDIFRGVFGNSEMMTRVRPLFEWQKGSADGNANQTGSRGLMFIENVMPQPVDYYFWAGGGTGYFQADDLADLNTVWDLAEFNTNTWVNPKQNNMQSMCAAFGMRRAIYEGGPSFGDQLGGSSTNPLGEDAVKDPRIKTEIIEHQQGWNKCGGGLFGYFVLGGDYRWGFMSRPSDINSYKLQGIDAIKGQSADAITYGAAVSSSATTLIWGDQWKITNLGNGDYRWFNSTPSDAKFKINTGLWCSYDFHVTADGTYKVRINYLNATTDAQIKVYEGCKSLGTQSISGSGSTDWFTFTATDDRLFAIRVEAVTGSFEVDKVEMTGGSSSCSVALSKTSHNFTSAAGSTTATVTSSQAFTVSDNATWISTSVSGSTITISVTENTGTSQRSGTVTVTGCETKTIAITQDAPASCSVVLSAASLDFTSAASGSNVTVTSSQAFTVSDNASWISTSVSGSTIAVSVTENTGTSQRTGTVTVTGCETKTIAVTQNAPSGNAYQYWRFTATGVINDAFVALDAIDLMQGSTAYNMSGWVKITTFPGSVTKNFGSQISPDAIRLDPVYTLNRAPNGFTVEASNDGSSWVLIHTETGLTTADYNGTTTTTTFPFAAAPPQYTITVNAGTGGTATGGGTYVQDASVTVSATPNSGYRFVNWTEGGTQVSTNASYTFTATANRTLTANFELLPTGYRYIRVTVTATNTTDGRLRLNDFKVAEDGVWYSVSNGVWDNSSVLPAIKTLDMGSGNVINPDEFNVYTMYDLSRTPKNFTIDGSNDASSWTTIFTATNWTSTSYAANTSNIFPISGAKRSMMNSKELSVIRAYPNPVEAGSLLNIDLGEATYARILLTDLSGKVVRDIQACTSQVQLSTGGLGKGVYVLKMQTENHTESMKLIVK